MTNDKDLGLLIRNGLNEQEIEILDAIDSLADRYLESDGRINVKNCDGLPNGYKAAMTKIDSRLYIGVEATELGTERLSPRTPLDLIRFAIRPVAIKIEPIKSECVELTLRDGTKYLSNTSMEIYGVYRLVQNGTIQTSE